MSTNLVCFLFGIPATYFWVRGLRRGSMYVGGFRRFIRSNDDPLYFWLLALLWGSMALGALVMPVLSWLGLRA